MTVVYSTLDSGVVVACRKLSNDHCKSLQQEHSSENDQRDRDVSTQSALCHLRCVLKIRPQVVAVLLSQWHNFSQWSTELMQNQHWSHQHNSVSLLARNGTVLKLTATNQACQFIAEIFSKICGPVKLEICVKNMRNMLRSHVRYKLACLILQKIVLKCGFPTMN